MNVSMFGFTNDVGNLRAKVKRTVGCDFSAPQWQGTQVHGA